MKFKQIILYNFHTKLIKKYIKNNINRNKKLRFGGYESNN